MSTTRKYKYARKELEEVFNVPTSTQTIVKITEPRGNNLHEVEESSGVQYLVSMPNKFRKCYWVKEGDYVIVEHIQEGNKVKAEIVSVLDRRHIKYLQQQKCWPEDFNINTDKTSLDQDELFVNRNRQICTDSIDSDSSESDD